MTKVILEPRIPIWIANWYPYKRDRFDRSSSSSSEDLTSQRGEVHVDEKLARLVALAKMTSFLLLMRDLIGI